MLFEKDKQNHHDIGALQEELSSSIMGIKQGEFPKNPGDHCKYCPSYNTCLGVAIHTN
ncbi:PD-(D/E)XK nuclease family protein [Pontibacter rugosus]